MEIAALRMLVVEDHQFQRWLAETVVREAGAKAVFCAADGRAALDVLSVLDPPIDVVVSDLDMPGMDGMELVRHIAAQRHRAALVIVTSMDPKVAAAVETMARAYGVEFLGTIQKPLTGRKLMAVLESYVPATPLTADFAFTGEDVAQGLKQGQFESLFQPKVEVKTGRLAGAETLGRWRHPERGFVNPRHFIDLADASGLMDPLTITMVRNAARCWRGLHRAGFEVPLSVNLSISSLTDPSFADRILAVVREEQVDPPQLIFEVTESLAASDLGATLENLSRLRIKGFGLSLDDYGTGYSSMQRLSRIPFTELKIDASFVKTASGNSQSYAMVESSIELARKLRIDAVGEGVETREEFDLLLTLGCPVAQGYYIARPMSATQLVDWAQARLHISASG